jgi:hypothetical protein
MPAKNPTGGRLRDHHLDGVADSVTTTYSYRRD